MKKIIMPAMLMLMACSVAFAQEEKKSTMFNGATNLQLFYDFGSEREYATSTLEGFYSDPWGNTFFFGDFYFNNTTPDQKSGVANIYFEIERCFNFWQNTALAPLSFEVEYDGGTYGSSSLCLGLNYFLHTKNFKNTFNLALLYTQNFGYDMNSYQKSCPVKFTGVWGLQDLFGAKGLRFSGFVDIWGITRNWQADKQLVTDYDKQTINERTYISILSEPQLWYCIGQLFGCPNLNIGGEVELSYNFSGAKEGFVCNPCLGAKWVF